MRRTLAPKQGPANSQEISGLHGSLSNSNRTIAPTIPGMVRDRQICGGPRPYRQDLSRVQACYSVLLSGRNSKIPSSQWLQQSSKDGSPVRLTTMASRISAGRYREASGLFAAEDS